MKVQTVKAAVRYHSTVLDFESHHTTAPSNSYNSTARRCRNIISRARHRNYARCIILQKFMLENRTKTKKDLVQK